MSTSPDCWNVSRRETNKGQFLHLNIQPLSSSCHTTAPIVHYHHQAFAFLLPVPLIFSHYWICYCVVSRGEIVRHNNNTGQICQVLNEGNYPFRIPASHQSTSTFLPSHLTWITGLLLSPLESFLFSLCFTQTFPTEYISRTQLTRIYHPYTWPDIQIYQPTILSRPLLSVWRIFTRHDFVTHSVGWIPRKGKVDWYNIVNCLLFLIVHFSVRPYYVQCIFPILIWRSDRVSNHSEDDISIATTPTSIPLWEQQLATTNTHTHSNEWVDFWWKVGILKRVVKYTASG